MGSSKKHKEKDKDREHKKKRKHRSRSRSKERKRHRHDRDREHSDRDKYRREEDYLESDDYYPKELEDVEIKISSKGLILDKNNKFLIRHCAMWASIINVLDHRSLKFSERIAHGLVKRVHFIDFIDEISNSCDFKN